MDGNTCGQSTSARSADIRVCPARAQPPQPTGMSALPPPVQRSRIAGQPGHRASLLPGDLCSCACLAVRRPDLLRSRFRRPAVRLLPGLGRRLQRRVARHHEMEPLAPRRAPRRHQHLQRGFRQRRQAGHHHLHQRRHPLHRDDRHRRQVPVEVRLLGGQHRLERRPGHVVGLLDAVAHDGLRTSRIP